MTRDRQTLRRRPLATSVAVGVAAVALAAAVSLADAHPASTASAVLATRGAAVHGAAGADGEPWPCVGGQDGATVRRLSVPTSSNHRAGVVVVIPPGAGADAPVVYLLHGYPDSPASPLDAGLACSTRGAAGRWPAFVLAVPDGTGWQRGDHEWADAADGDDQIETWLTRSVVGISGYYEVDDPEDVFAGDAALEVANSPENLGRPGGLTLPSALDPPLRVALVQGDDEPDLIDGSGERMAAVLRENGVAATDEARPGGHDWDFVVERWPGLMTWATRSWDAPTFSRATASPGSP